MNQILVIRDKFILELQVLRLGGVKPQLDDHDISRDASACLNTTWYLA